jgi:ribosome maturation protein Sdo1
MKIHLMRTDRRTDITKIIVAFRSFANAHRSGHKGKGEDYMQVLNTTTIVNVIRTCHFGIAPFAVLIKLCKS